MWNRDMSATASAKSLSAPSWIGLVMTPCSERLTRSTSADVICTAVEPPLTPASMTLQLVLLYRDLIAAAVAVRDGEEASAKL